MKKKTLLACAVLCTLFGMNACAAADDTPTNPAENTEGVGLGITIGTGSITQYAHDVAIGKDATTFGGFDGYYLDDSQKSEEYPNGVWTAATSDELAVLELKGVEISVGADIAIGQKATATGTSSIAIGPDSSALAFNATALGANANASDKHSTAVGTSAVATGIFSTALGTTTEASGMSSTAVGNEAVAMGKNSTALGNEAKAVKDYSTAVGVWAQAKEEESTALGNKAEAVSKYSVALGTVSKAEGESSVALGNNAKAIGINSAALGSGAQANGEASVAWGSGAIAEGISSTALGTSAKAQSVSSIAIGNAADAMAQSSIALGTTALAEGLFSIALGPNSLAKGQAGIAIGNLAIANEQDSVALGSGAQAKGAASVAWGSGAIADGVSSTALGTTAQALKSKAIAIGNSAQATEEWSIALGTSAQATKVNSMALGTEAAAKGEKSIALGLWASASDGYESNMALGNQTEAAGSFSVALGVLSKAKGTSSIAIGNAAQTDMWESVAIGAYAHAVQHNSIALGNSAAAVGSGSIAFGTNARVGKTKTDENGNEKLVLDENFDNAIAFGNSAQAEGIGSTALGASAHASDQYSLALGTSSQATNLSAVAVGNDSLASGKRSVAVGVGTRAYGDFSIAIGVDAEAKDSSAVAVGNFAKATDSYNVALGADSNDGNGVKGYTAEKLYTDTDLVAGLSDGGLKIAVTNFAGIGSDTVLGTVSVGYTDENGVLRTRTLTNVAAGMISRDSTDAINGSQLYAVAEGLQDNIEYLENYVNDYVTTHPDDTDKHIEKGEYAVGDITLQDGSESQGVTMDIVDKDGNKTGERVVITDVAKASDVGDINNFNDTVINTDASTTTVVDAINNIDNRVTNIDNRVTNIENNISDIAKEAGKRTEVTVEGGKEAGKGFDSDGNRIYNGGNLQLNVTEGKDGQDVYDVKLNNNLDLGTDGSIAFGDVNNTYIDASKIEIGDTHIANNQIKVGDEVTITNEQINVGDTYITENKIHLDDKHYLTNNEFKMGDVIVNDNSISVGDTVTINNDQREFKVGGNVNVDMGGNIIHNVAPGVEDTDAVNVSQLKELNQDITNNSARISRLGSRINKVGAGAAALAGLHPLDFDPDDKFYFSAGYGHYRGENAVSVGAFYQPNDDTLFSVASTVGNDDDMISAGITWRFGQNSNQSRSKKAMAKEIIELRTEIAELKAMVYSLTGYGLDLEKAKLFPDTPENHWAYDYVAVVAGNGILEGYPNGKFDGSRPMTRYEMAAVVYRLLQKGVQVDNRMLQEFAPELARVRVDTLTHYNDGAPHIQRVRVIEGRG